MTTLSLEQIAALGRERSRINPSRPPAGLPTFFRVTFGGSLAPLGKVRLTWHEHLSGPRQGGWRGDATASGVAVALEFFSDDPLTWRLELRASVVTVTRATVMATAPRSFPWQGIGTVSEGLVPGWVGEFTVKVSPW